MRELKEAIHVREIAEGALGKSHTFLLYQDYQDMFTVKVIVVLYLVSKFQYDQSRSAESHYSLQGVSLAL